jgi:hypothetical protein
MMTLKLRPIVDGYTFKGVFDGTRDGLPTIGFEYRPCSPTVARDYQWRRDRAGTSAEDMAVIREAVLKYMSAWDVTDLKGVAVKIEDGIDNPMVPLPFLVHVYHSICGYVGPKQEKDEKNLSTAQG